MRRGFKPFFSHFWLIVLSLIFILLIKETVNNLNLHIKANALELKDTSAGKIIKNQEIGWVYFVF